MGFFGKKGKLVGNFELSHYLSKGIVYKTDLRPGLAALNYGFYLDKVVYNLGKDNGTRLYKRIAEIASADAIEGKDQVSEKERPPLEECTLSINTEYRIVESCEVGNPLIAKAELWEGGKRYYIQTDFSPQNYPDTEKVVAGGCEALFVYMFNQGNKEEKFALPFFFVGQTNWYEENGYPSVGKVGLAPYAGMAVVRQITAQN